MPDEKSVPSAESLEKLMSEAMLPEQATTTSPIGLHPTEPAPPQGCQHVDTQISERGWCKVCHKIICPHCKSFLDPDYCNGCLSVPDTELREQPLKDADGVVHEGRELIPAPTAHYYQPRFGTLSKTLSEMNDAELDEHIKRFRDLIKQAELALDFRRVVLSASVLEQGERADAKRRKLRADKTKYPIKTIGFDKNGKKVTKTAPVGDMLKMLEMLAALGKQQAAKQQPGAPAPVTTTEQPAKPIVAQPVNGAPRSIALKPTPLKRPEPKK